MADRFTVSMTTLSGDPDLYLTVFNGGGPAGACGETRGRGLGQMSVSLRAPFRCSALTALSLTPPLISRPCYRPRAAYYPTVTNFTYAAYGVTGNELLIVKPSPILGAPGVCNVGVPCTLAISVFGFVGGSYKCVAACQPRGG